MGQSDIEDSNLCNELVDVKFLPCLSDALAKLAGHSIDAQRIADLGLHDFFIEIYDTWAISGDDVKSPPRKEECLQALQVRFESTRTVLLRTTLTRRLNQLATGPGLLKDEPSGYCNTNHDDGRSDSLGSKFSNFALEAIAAALSGLRVGDLNTANSLWHIIRSGMLEWSTSAACPEPSELPPLRFAVKGSCGYLCRWAGEAAADVQVHAYFAYTEFGTAMKIDINRILYNVFDTRFEHQTCVPVVREGDMVFVSDKRLKVLAWG